MKRITRVISMISGAVASLFTVGCMKPAGDVYGPPDSFDRYRETAESDQEAPGAEGEGKLDRDPAPAFPESEEEPKKIYGPPEMLEVMPEPQVMPDAPDKQASDSQEAEDEKAQKRDFETLKEINKYPREGKKVYGPPPARK